MKQKDTSPKRLLVPGLAVGYAVFIALSWILGFEPGKQVSVNFYSFFRTMILMMPVVFVLIGLFEVWVSRETIERHLGAESGIRGYCWATLLAGTVMGPLYVALPVGAALFRKGARLSVVFTYIGASGICRVPMTVFEATFLGVKFTVVRFLVSLPLVIVSAILLEKYAGGTGYAITEPDNA